MARNCGICKFIKAGGNQHPVRPSVSQRGINIMEFGKA